MSIEQTNTGGASEGAQGGEGLAQQLINELGQMRQELSKAKAAIDRAERRRTVERAAIDAQARDIQAAADAIEQRVSGGAEVSQAVRDAKRDRPGLFAPSGPRLIAGEVGAGTGESPTLAILRERASTGDRASLLLYLRARREKR